MNQNTPTAFYGFNTKTGHCVGLYYANRDRNTMKYHTKHGTMRFEPFFYE